MKRTNARWAIVFAAIISSVMIFSSCTSSEPTYTIDNDPTPLQDEPERPEPATLTQVEVLRTVDGDTIEILLDGAKEKLRFIGIDTPESVASDPSRNVPYGKVAAEFTKEKLEGQTIRLEFDVQERDQYGRLLAYVYIDDMMFNKMLLDEGHASVLTTPPNVKYVEVFTAAQKNARDAGRGQWNNSTEAEESKCIASSRSYRFHTMTCNGGQQIATKNIIYFSSRDEALDAGFAPCKTCNP